MAARLGHLIEMRGIGLITGESGSGKTCACRKVVTALHAGLYRVVYVSLSTGNVMDLYSEEEEYSTYCDDGQRRQPGWIVVQIVADVL
jgi:type II secretory pathway predicted ATPase ExeA